MSSRGKSSLFSGFSFAAHKLRADPIDQHTADGTYCDGEAGEQKTLSKQHTSGGFAQGEESHADTQEEAMEDIGHQRVLTGKGQKLGNFPELCAQSHQEPGGSGDE